mmetsp:Transcript_13541/g.18172  ORF Transcript_13541/g.18172 Transcript_13541/m.18172 type:complete len:284 (+) Transcript_13541:49-900(+)
MMNLRFSFSLSLLLSCPLFIAGKRNAFVFLPGVKPHPSLHDRTEAQAGVALDINLIIGGESDQSQSIALTGLRFQLNDEKITDKSSYPPLPGADGPNPDSSSGARFLSVIKQPYFVSIEGLQQVELLQACWEMVWRDDEPAGSIVCGFDVPAEVRRNTYSASLPAGKLYLSLAVFTEEGLEETRARKIAVETRSESFLRERDDELELMQNTNNILMKAVHYRNAFAAAEKFLMSKKKHLPDVPLEEVASIGNELFMCKKGKIWTKENGKQVLLGYATVGTSDP